MAEIIFNPGSQIKQVALGIDIRGGDLFSELFAGLDSLREQGYDYEIIFLDASDEELIKRYKETRRKHPLAQGDRLTVGIAKERAMLEEVKEKANYILDTTYILTRELKEEIQKIFSEDNPFNNLIINILSFGFKYGIPSDSDLVLMLGLFLIHIIYQKCENKRVMMQKYNTMFYSGMRQKNS